MNKVLMTSIFTLALTLAGPTVVAACDQQGCFGDKKVKIEVKNDADVTNDVYVSASTGGNDANGGNGGAGGNAGRGGDDAGHGGQGGSTTNGLLGTQTGGNGGNGGSTGTGGAGGNGGQGGNGGTIVTGDAIGTGTIVNDVNSTEVKVVDCGCETDPATALLNAMQDDEVKIKVDNKSAKVHNDLDVKAKTGYNDADGGDGGNGGKGGRGGDGAGNGGTGGSVDNAPLPTECGCQTPLLLALVNGTPMSQTGGNGGTGGSTGAGGKGGEGWDAGNGGSITTGKADSLGEVHNRVNSTVIRVRR